MAEALSGADLLSASQRHPALQKTTRQEALRFPDTLGLDTLGRSVVIGVAEAHSPAEGGGLTEAYSVTDTRRQAEELPAC